jgi:pimeloyl-ACP methyl ester carboxylesterase
MYHRSECHIPSTTISGETWYAVAWLTVPEHVVRDELQVLVHGATYDHRSWDWPLDPERYSYLEWATERGYATLAIDRVGCGASSKPPGRQSTLAAQARVLHDIVTAARGGALGTKFGRVVLVGHSMGSALSVAEASEYRDVDAVVLTGSLGMDARTLNNDPRDQFTRRSASKSPGNFTFEVVPGTTSTCTARRTTPTARPRSGSTPWWSHPIP